MTGLRFIILLAVLIMGLMAIASNQALAGPYFSGGYVSSSLNPDVSSTATIDSRRFDDEATGFTARFGWQFNRYLTIEGDFTNYGESERTYKVFGMEGLIDQTVYRYSGQSLGAFLTVGDARLLSLYNSRKYGSDNKPLNLGIYGRVGLIGARIKAEVTNANSEGRRSFMDATDDGIGLGYGFGFSASMDPVGLFVEFNWVDVATNFGGSTSFTPEYLVGGIQLNF